MSPIKNGSQSLINYYITKVSNSVTIFNYILNKFKDHLCETNSINNWVNNSLFQSLMSCGRVNCLLTKNKSAICHWLNIHYLFMTLLTNYKFASLHLIRHIQLDIFYWLLSFLETMFLLDGFPGFNVFKT